MSKSSKGASYTAAALEATLMSPTNDSHQGLIPCHVSIVIE